MWSATTALLLYTGRRYKPVLHTFSTACASMDLPSSSTHSHTHHTSVPPSPTNVVVVRFDPTTIGVSWTKFTLVKLKGLASYIVTYNIVISSKKRQLGGTITVPWTKNRVIIPNLQPGAQYDITVTTSTLAGMSGTLQYMSLESQHVK